MTGPRQYIEYDWYPEGIPGNVIVGRNAYIDTSYGFVPCDSEEDAAVVLGEASGAYDQATFILGPHARVIVGPYSVVKCQFVCEELVNVGAYCLISWGTVLTDTWLMADRPAAHRRAMLEAAARHPTRRLIPAAAPRPVTLEDNVWLGFDSVVMPGVTIGRGSIIGSKTVVKEDIPPYSVVVGNPARIVRRLDADDTEEARVEALREYLRPDGAYGNWVDR